MRRQEDRATRRHAREQLSAADLHLRLLEQYGPPSIVVDRDLEIVHVSDTAAQYLQYAAGEPSHSLLRAIRPELGIELRTTLNQAAQQRTTVEAPGLVVRLDDRTVSVNLIVRPVVHEDDHDPGFFLVLFQERIERHEVQSAELAASNHELQAMNEQLRSSAEELKANKKELQSLNDELRTLNQALKIKMDEHQQANDDVLQERAQAEERARGLLRRLLTVQEGERRRIARELHDHVGQQLAGLRLKIDAITEVGHVPAELRDVVEDAQRTISKIDRELDFLAWELRPAALTQLGLPTALGNFIREWSREFGIDVDYHTRGLDGHWLAYEIETCLYRIAQEALNNVYKHARAGRVGVILERRRDQLVLLVEDDGVGFDPLQQRSSDEDRGIGLLGMQERAALISGRVEVESEPGKGTTLFVRVTTDSENTAR